MTAPATRYDPPMPDLLLVLIVILVLALLWRGPKTLPRLGEALGRGVREARKEATKPMPTDPAAPGDEPKPGA
jgi:Sec-independent protein translocase protein TatA